MKNWKDNISKLKTARKKSGKWFWVGLGGLLVLALVISSAFKSVEAETYEVKKSKVISTVWEKGKVQSRDSKNIFSEVQGKVKEVRADSGDPVKKDDILAVVDVSDLEAQISRLEGELKAVEGLEQVAQSQADSSQIKSQQLAVEQARLERDLAVEAYERAKQLFEIGGVTKVELDQAKSDMESRQKAVTQAESALSALNKQNRGSKMQYQGQKESLLAQLDQLRTQKEKATITAGIDGVVFVKKIKEGDIVSPGVLLFTVGNKGEIDIETFVNNKDIANIKEGDRVTVVFKVPGTDIESPAMINKIAPAAEEVVSSLGIIEDKIRITVDLQERPADITITPGMTVDVVLITQKTARVLAVPKQAVFTDKTGDFVWAVRGGKAELAKVSTGTEGDDLIEIKSGLKEGDRVILNPHLPELKEGIRIKG